MPCVERGAYLIAVFVFAVDGYIRLFKFVCYLVLLQLIPEVAGNLTERKRIGYFINPISWSIVRSQEPTEQYPPQFSVRILRELPAKIYRAVNQYEAVRNSNSFICLNLSVDFRIDASRIQQNPVDCRENSFCYLRMITS